jgi:hypothetical protein
MVSIRPSNARAVDVRSAGQAGRPHAHTAARTISELRDDGPFHRLAQRLGAAAVAVALVLTVLAPAPAFGADAPAATAGIRQTAAPRGEGEQQDAFDGGYFPAGRQLIVPSIEVGLTQDRPIPLGVTCSCTIDRTGLVSQFDLTVIEVVQDAYPMVRQLNRFNRPPRPGARYVAAYVGQQYIAGPENQAYTISDADWKATASDQRLSDTAQLLHQEPEYRPRAEVFPSNYVNGWLIFELPLDRPAYLIWNYNFVGERGVWFALQ